MKPRVHAGQPTQGARPLLAGECARPEEGPERASCPHLQSLRCRTHKQAGSMLPAHSLGGSGKYMTLVFPEFTANT